MPLYRKISRALLAALFIFTGAAHFLYAENFAAIIPDFLSRYALFLVYLTGALEIAGAVGLLIPRLRWRAGAGLAALLAVMVIANINMAIKGIPLPGLDLPRWVYWARPFLQPLLIWWALRAGEII